MDLIDGIQLLRFFAALAFVLALMGGLYLVLQRVQSRGPMRMGARRRLQISEIMPLDGRRRAILLRRDDKEHLVIFGPNGETVIESGIKAPKEQDAGKEEQSDKPAQNKNIKTKNTAKDKKGGTKTKKSSKNAKKAA